MIQLNNSNKVYNYLKHHISFEQEEVWIICLNSQKKPLVSKRLFMGTANACTWHPREVLKTVFMSSCTSFVLCHSHPSGEPSPSEEDKVITKRLTKIANLIAITLDDHIILCKDSYYSFTDQALN